MSIGLLEYFYNVWVEVSVLLQQLALEIYETGSQTEGPLTKLFSQKLACLLRVYPLRMYANEVV